MKNTPINEGTVLIVDDNPANIFALEQLLEEKGRTILKATSGKEGLAIAMNKVTDLIILDVQMPEMDGFEVARILRSGKQTKDIPILFATAEKKEQSSVMKGFQEGAIDYLFKPLDPAVTKAKVSVLLKLELQRKELVRKNILLERSTLLINNSADIIGILDPKRLKFDEVNNTFSVILGHPIEVARSITVNELVHPDDVKLVLNQINSKKEKLFFEARVYTKDGSIKWLHWHLAAREEKWFVNATDITEIKQGERVESELKRVASIVDSSSDAIISETLKGIITGWNKGAELLFGYTEKEALGQNIVLLLPPDRKDEDAKMLASILAHNKMQDFQTKRVRKDGSTVDVSIAVSPIKDDHGNIVGGSKIARDITDQKKSEAKLERSLKEIADYKYALDESGIVAITDQKGIIHFANDNFCKISKYTREELLGQDHRIINSGYHTQEFIRNLWTTIAKGKVWRGELKNKAKDGTIYWVDTTIVPFLNEHGKPYQYVAIRSDITERKVAEESIKLMNQNLEAATHAAELANRTKSQFLANMSHEIRTPLNAVIGLSHLALKTELTAKQADYLKKIQSSSESLLGIINDILDFSKVESGKLTLEETTFDLEESLQNLANVITYKANTKGLEIAFGIDSKVPTYLIGDPGRLEQILINLCSNAVKFTHEGEVVVKVTVKEESSERIQLKFEVNDTGIGMDQMQLDKLFQPFTQADDTISRKYGGTGLGLSIIKRLVELMEGEVWVESTPGKGSSFFFTIWLKKQGRQRKMPAPSLDLRKLSVLLVDDNKPSRDIIKAGLESFSFQVTAVSSGIQAIHFLKNNFHHNPVKVVLLDWNMPVMNGVETARIIRQDEDLASVKIIMVCNSYASEELYEMVDELNLSGILIKPIRHSKLYDLMIGAIENGERKKRDEFVRQTEQKKQEKHEGTILLVEDNEINQQVACELLNGFGFDVEVANNGQEALEKVSQSGTPSKYGLILMDLQMPVMGGRKATVEIRKLIAYEKLPIIAMTADAMVSVKEDCLAIGMNDFLTKPINPHKMLETIEKWIAGFGVISEKADDSLKESKMPDMEGIDVKDGLLHLGGNRQLYHKLLLQFHHNHKQFVKDVTSRFKSTDQENARRMIHSLKGVAGNLGMVRLHSLCKELEESTKLEQTGKYTELILPLAKELDLVMGSIGKNIVEQKQTKKKFTHLELKNKLDELKVLIEQSDPEAADRLTELGVITGLEKQVEILTRALTDYNFDEALKLLKKIRVGIEEGL